MQDQPNIRLQRLEEAGVSIWLDTLSRELLESGESSDLVQDYGVTGATSNPTIFAKAIIGSQRYDEQLRSLASEATLDTRELFFAIALEDVRRAAAVLPPIHEHTGGRGDGFVSFGCTPDLADDTRGRSPRRSSSGGVSTCPTFDQGAGHVGGRRRHRAAHRSRSQRQRDAAVLG
jgi:Transaldolase/Fructose-6-phosphate aldolase